MPIDLTSIKGNVSEFNQKYGVNFDIDRFISKSRGFTQSSTINNFNKNYYNTVQGFAKQIIQAKNNGTLNISASVCDMLDDFESIMDDYRRECSKENSSRYPARYGGKEGSVYLNDFSKLVDTIPATRVDQVAEKYKRGEIRIRDMVSFATNIDNSTNLDAPNTLAANILALRKVNASRSALWRFFHPFRFNAERREADFMEQVFEASQGMKLVDTIGALTGRPDELKRVESLPYQQVNETLLNKRIEQGGLEVLRSRVEKHNQDMLEQAEIDVQSRRNVEAQLKESAARERYTRLVGMHYIPMINSMDREASIINEIDQAIQQGIVTDDDAISAFNVNKEIYNETKAYIDQNGTKNCIKFMEQKAGEWSQKYVNAEVIETNVDEAMKGFFKQSISVDLEPKAVNAGVSQFIEGNQIKIDGPVQQK